MKEITWSDGVVKKLLYYSPKFNELVIFTLFDVGGGIEGDPKFMDKHLIPWIATGKGFVEFDNWIFLGDA